MNNNENKSEHLDKFEQSMASLDKAQIEIKACMDGMPMPEQANEASYATLHEHMKKMHSGLVNAMASLHDTMRHANNFIHERIDRSNAHINNRMDKHMEGHAPAFKSNAHLENFLKACDMESDYQAQPKDISVSSYSNMMYASKISATKKGLKVEVDFSKPKDKK